VKEVFEGEALGETIDQGDEGEASRRTSTYRRGFKEKEFDKKGMGKKS